MTFEYTVPNANITRTPEFRWEYTDWSACTVTCGGGTQLSPPKCVEIEAGLVEETYCSALDKPPEKSRACNKHACPSRFVMWSIRFRVPPPPSAPNAAHPLFKSNLLPN